MSYTIQELKIGQSDSFSKTITETDVYLFAGITGDLNPAHVDVEYSKNTRFGKRIAHGMLSAGLISTVLGTKLPGAGTIYLSQQINFLAPVYFGDTITAVIEVEELMSERNRAILHTYCKNQEGKIVADGKATVMPPGGQQGESNYI